MPLRITNAVTDVSLINRWAEDIERTLTKNSNQLNQIFTSIHPVNGAAPAIAITTSFDKINTGTNTKATMGVGSGASLQYVNNGVVNANEVGGIGVAGNTPSHAGQLLISQPGNTTAVWADPLVQGLNAPGTSTKGLNPVLIGGSTPNGSLQDVAVDGNGNVGVNLQQPILELLAQILAQLKALNMNFAAQTSSSIDTDSIDSTFIQ